MLTLTPEDVKARVQAALEKDELYQLYMRLRNTTPSVDDQKMMRSLADAHKVARVYHRYPHVRSCAPNDENGVYIGHFQYNNRPIINEPIWAFGDIIETANPDGIDMDRLITHMMNRGFAYQQKFDHENAVYYCMSVAWFPCMYLIRTLLSYPLDTVVNVSGRQHPLFYRMMYLHIPLDSTTVVLAESIPHHLNMNCDYAPFKPYSCYSDHEMKLTDEQKSILPTFWNVAGYLLYQKAKMTKDVGAMHLAQQYDTDPHSVVVTEVDMKDTEMDYLIKGILYRASQSSDVLHTLRRIKGKKVYYYSNTKYGVDAMGVGENMYGRALETAAHIASAWEEF